ncbi:MAG: septal ring lytic transglycosylase RlpA family protein [Betaproteobacteria bacterium]|nr:septal ring lytic transglycosylase RlpA family protein [Betaproteobacteria bacterium]
MIRNQQAPELFSRPASITGVTLTFVGLAWLAACAEMPLGFTPQTVQKPASIPTSLLLKKPGGFYTDDGPDGALPVDLDLLAEPVPKLEPMNAQANQAYSVFGREYLPLNEPSPYKRQGTASWYGRKFHGQRTSSGEVYDMFALSAAHPTLPIPSYARIVNLQNGNSVVVRINDRGPFSSGRIMDVSYAAAHRLGFVQEALANIEVQSIVPGAALAAASPARPALALTNAPEIKTEASPPQFPIAAEQGGIFLQLGAFSNPTNAENFSNRVRRELDWLKQALSVTGRNNLYRLQLGPFRDRAEANTVSQKIRESLEVRPMVITR